MKVGDTVMWKGRECVLRGLDPMSVSGRTADIEDLVTGERFRVPLVELEDPDDAA